MFEASVVGPLGILVALVKRNIGQGSSKSGIFSGITSMIPFLEISFIMVIETWQKCWWIRWEIFFLKNHSQFGKQYYCLYEGWIWRFAFEDSHDCLESIGAISNSDLEGQKSYNVQDVQKQPFEIQQKNWGHLMRWCWKGYLNNNKLAPLDI